MVEDRVALAYSQEDWGGPKEVTTPDDPGVLDMAERFKAWCIALEEKYGDDFEQKNARIEVDDSNTKFSVVVLFEYIPKDYFDNTRKEEHRYG